MRRGLRPPVKPVPGLKIAPCVCGHLLHWQGHGQCVDCLCRTYVADLMLHNLGFFCGAT